MKPVHLDHNATTPLRPEVEKALRETLGELGGNPSSLHGGGRRARQCLDEARERCAGALGVGEDEVIFTSGGTESNNLALLGGLRALGPGAGLLHTGIEHSSVLEVAAQLAREGHPTAVLPVERDGSLDPEVLRSRLEATQPKMLSIQGANNEVGVVLPCGAIGEVLAELPGDARPRWHADLVQCLGRVPLRIREWGIDYASLSAHKVGGPVGVGVLLRRAGAPLQPLMFGGGQENGLRPGTENVAGAVAASFAIELAVQEQARHGEHLASLAARLWQGLERELPQVRLIGPPMGSEARLPGTVGVIFPGNDGKVLVTRLDLEGLECSSGSACASGSVEASHVLLALQHGVDEARAALRLSVGRGTTVEDVEQAVDILRRTMGGTRAT